MHRYLNRPLPQGLEGLTDLALDLSWNWNRGGDQLWKTLDPELWERTNNPYLILQSVSETRLNEVARDEAFKQAIRGCFEERARYLAEPGWFARRYSANDLKGVAYFSMEFGLTEALPIYSGGLGVLAGDLLRTASDLGVPLVGIGLLYQQGYFRQVLPADGRQLEAFPYNDPASLPVAPVRNRDGGWLRVKLELPGRRLVLRVWEAQVGKVRLLLLDSNDPLNSPWDRAITSNLYAANQEQRLLQEVILGIGGWQVIVALELDVEVCHLNEGHAAMVVLARARSFMQRSGKVFADALCATRPGNVFTTHTPVAAAFDRFDPDLVRHYARFLPDMLGISVEQLLALGRANSADGREPFNMAYLALRGCGYVNAVSRLHRTVSRQIFAPLFPGWPLGEVPIASITNGAHQASWDSACADRFWLCTCGADRWRGATEELPAKIAAASDDDIWTFRSDSRRKLIEYVRHRFERQMREHDAAPQVVHRAAHVLDHNALTLGFARRFAAYKRPNLLLRDAERLARILKDAARPVQLIVAGKAHPADPEGKCLVQAMACFTARADLFDRAVFLEDYDLALSQALVGGIDVWINTPRRPWEACGTSGMKVLANGGLNLSELDGWWAEAYSPDVGWALGDGTAHTEPNWDAVEAEQLYDLLEREVIPEFYDRDPNGLPRAWIQRVRQSMARLTPRFSGNRMLREYVENAYLPAAAAYRRRVAHDGQVAGELQAWTREMDANWKNVHFGEVRAARDDGAWHFDVQLYLGDVDPDSIRVELYAESGPEEEAVRIPMERDGSITGAINSHRYLADAAATRPPNHYTPRVMPFRADANIPLEEPRIQWFRGETSKR